MKTTQKININIEETFKNTVAGNKEFHFYVDELSWNNSMPTYIGLADEKYKFKEMNEDFFKFLNEKANDNGIYLRLVFSIVEENDDELKIQLNFGDDEEIFIIKNTDNVFKFHYVDFGIKIKSETVTFGLSIDYEDDREIFFQEFTQNGVLSLDNHLNQYIFGIMKGMIK